MSRGREVVRSLGLGGRMLKIRSKGFSLIELMVAVVLVTIMLSIGFTGLNKARTAGGSRGLATAVAAEFRLAREKAIAKGSPVAVVVEGGVTRSLFFLEGDTMPVVTRTVNYDGDYPDGAIAVATYPGPDFSDSMDIPGAKSDEWKARLASWLPDEYSDAKVFMFTPNGSVVTNNLPAAEGTYRVLVATGIALAGNTLKGAGEPQTVAISQTGAVETFGHLLGGDGGVGGGGFSPSVAAPPYPPTGYTTVAPTILKSRVTPPAELVDGEMVHVLDKGEYLTLEIFARSGDGRPLYAGWNDDPVSKGGNPAFKGAFSVPGAELERMEFYPEFNIADHGEPENIQQDIWRSVWTWTPPPNADAGDQYNLTVDVTDAKKTERAALPDLDPVIISPPGELVFESNRTGTWQLFTMWADGSRQIRLTKDDTHHHRWASATADGRMLAFQRTNLGGGNPEVWVMNFDGTGAIKVANGRYPTISPRGDSIAFYHSSDPLVRVKRLDATGGSDFEPTALTSVGGLPAGEGVRIAYSADGKWIYYAHQDRDKINAAKINFIGDSGVSLGTPIPSVYVGNVNGTDPEVGGIFSGRGGQVYYHADGSDPYIGRFQTAEGSRGGALVGASIRRVSVGQNECFPAISPNEDLMIFCEQRGGTYQILRCGMGNWTSDGAGTPLTGIGENLRPAWIHQGGTF
jgi:prepilin-type N-terminal cleavage/methylation domain-containing protein